jgi:D-alanyl-D-alanine carboxypeptidase
VQTQAGIWRGSSESGRQRRGDRRRFGIASTTKTFIATVVLQLVDEGRLSLDDLRESAP